MFGRHCFPPHSTAVATYMCDMNKYVFICCYFGFQVEEAFATLEAWQGVADGLPALVDRLRALETLHLASASFAQRLEQVL